MSIQSFPLPDVGEGLTEAEIVSWHVAEGDDIAVNQVIVEIETAKAAVELPSPFAGRVHKLLVAPGVMVRVGTPIISVDTQPGSAGAQPSSETDGGPATESETAADSGGVKQLADGRIATLVGYVTPDSVSGRKRRRDNAAPAAPEMVPASTNGAPLEAPQPLSVGSRPQVVLTEPAGASSEAPLAPLAAPPVRKLAKDLGVDLRAVVATRTDGVITRGDVESASSRSSEPVTEAGAPPDPVAYDPATRERRVPIRGVRKATALAMVTSAFTAPHVTEFLTVDVTEMMALRERLRARREFADVKVTPLAFAARAVCLAAARTPEVNATWDADAGEIVLKEYVNLGIAAATPRGLMVPNIRDAGRMALRELAVAINALADTARAGKTQPADMLRGTFTITNVGVFGVDTGTPIINPGESAILALGSIKDAPWVVDGQLAVRKVCQLSLSFDHRVVDGQQGSQFLADVGALLSEPGLALAF